MFKNKKIKHTYCNCTVGNIEYWFKEREWFPAPYREPFWECSP